MKILRLASLLILFQLSAFAQVNVSIQILPPYPTKFQDYASKPQLVVIMITNTSTTTQKIQLRGSITGDNGIVIKSRDSYKSSSAIELGAGQTRTLNWNDIVYFFDYSNLQYIGITQAQFINKGGLPEGSYQFCLRAFNYDTNQPISADNPAGCSNSFAISSIEPPNILSPMHEQTLSSTMGQVFSIRWNTPVGAPPTTQYRIRMVEILGNRNPNDAIMTATQPYFFEKEVMTNMYVYSPADPQLTIGRRYALMVEAFDPSNNVAFRNNGRSEVIMFTYGEELIAEAKLPLKEDAIKIKTDTLPVRTTIVKGNLKYRFPESAESGLFSLSHTKVYLEKVYVNEKKDALGVSYYQPVSNSLAATTPFLTNPTDSTFATTDKNGNFEIRLAMTVLDSAGALSPYHQSLLNNKTKPYSDKREAIAIKGQNSNMAIMYQIRVSNPHFKQNSEYIRIVPGDTINLQQRTIDANSYQLNVNVSEAFNGLKGKFISGAKVRVYRLKANKIDKQLEIPLYEGNLLDSVANWKEYGDKVLIAEAITPTVDSLQINNQTNAKPYTAFIKRLFRNIGVDGDRYLISLEKGEQVLAQKSFDELSTYKLRKSTHIASLEDQATDVWEDFTYNLPADTAYLTLQKELTVSPRSKVTGILKYAFKYYSSIPIQPYANMRVTLRSSANLKHIIATAVTDQQGKFIFDFENVDSVTVDKFHVVGRGNMEAPSHVYYVVPEVKYYAIPNQKIIVQPWGSQDVGELVSMVKTYSLKIEAQGKDYKPESIGKVDMYGKKVPDVPAVPDPMGQAEVLVLRYADEPYKKEIPNLVGMNTDQKISFGNAVGNVMGETDDRSSPFVLQRKMYTEANGSTVVVKGLIPSIDLQKDRYQIRIGSGDRISNNVAYETKIFHFPEGRRIGNNPPIKEIEIIQHPGEIFQQEQDKLYDPTWGQNSWVQLDPGGAVIRNGITANQMVNSQAINKSVGLKKGATNAIGTGKIGFNFRSTHQKMDTKDWQTLKKYIADYQPPLTEKTEIKRRNNLGMIVVGPVINAEALVFNDQLPAQEEIFDELHIIQKKEWRIAGRAIDANSKLGIKNVRVSVLQKIGNGNQNQTYGSASANSNGDFVLTPSTMANYGIGQWNPEKDVALGINADGYKPLVLNIGKMVIGKQFYNEHLMLEPLGKNLYGYVVDADEKRIGVPARIKMIDNGVWVNSIEHTGKKHLDNMNNPLPDEEIRYAQRFSIDLPTTTVKLVIMPYDRGYLTDTVDVTVSQGNYYLGTFALTRRKHKMHITIADQNDKLVPALITLVENSLKDTINMDIKDKTWASFVFENNATKNYTIHVQPLSYEPIAGKNMFSPQTFTLNNMDDGQWKYHELTLTKGRLISGKVSFEDGKVAKNAKVYLESGSGSATDNAVLSNENGDYKLIIPQLNANQYTIRASYAEENKTYVSGEKTLSGNTTKVDLVIRKIEGIDITRLLGFKTRISSFKESSDGTYTISGEVYDVPVNANFSTTDSILNRNFMFHDIKIKPSTAKNSDNVPFAVPVNQNIITENREIGVKINQSFNGVIHGDIDRITINKTSSDTTGAIVGKVRILDNSFQFPSSYMRMESTDFYLGVNRGAETFAVFSSHNSSAVADKFMLTNKQGAAISFKYLGFKGVADINGNRISNLNGDKIQLFMNLSTMLPGNIPITLKAGEALISKGGIGKIVTSDTLSFTLEKWTVKAGVKQIVGAARNPNTVSWELSPTSGGLVLKRGEILTKKLNIPFTDMTIVPSEENVGGDLICNSLTDEHLIKNVNFNIGGIAKLKMRNGAKSMFIYDPGVGTDGRGHYKLSITGANFNDYPASFSGLDGMTNPRDEFKIQIISLLSNGEELFGFANDQSITYYNQIKFLPKTLSSSSQNSLSISGSIDLGIPGFNTKFYDALLYTKDGAKNKVTLPLFDFNFIGQGDVKFTSIATREAQQYKAEGYVIAGNLSLPGGVKLNGAKLISVVSEGAQKLLDATGASGTIPVGAAQEIKRQVDVVFGAKEQINEYFTAAEDQINAAKEQLQAEIQKAKDELIAKAEQAVKDAVTKVIPMGEDEMKGALSDLAGTWKLGNTTFNQAKDVIGAVKDGNYMKVAGMMKNIPGVNEAVKDLKNKVTMEAKNMLTAAQEKLPEFKDVPISAGGFEPGKFEFDLKNGRVFGNISFKIITVGAVTLRDGGMEMLFDRDGWYFCAGATMDIPVPILSPLKVGVLIGNYGKITDEIEGRVTAMAQSASKRLPPSVKQGLSGFFVVGGKPIVDINVGFGIPPIAEFKLVASAGAEVRTYAMFGKGSFTMGMGALVYGRLYASAGGLGIKVSGGVDIEVAVASTLKVANGSFGMCMQGCASAKLYMEACAPIVGCGSLDASVRFLLNLGVGTDQILRTIGCNKAGVEFSFTTGSESCTNSSDFHF